MSKSIISIPLDATSVAMQTLQLPFFKLWSALNLSSCFNAPDNATAFIPRLCNLEWNLVTSFLVEQKTIIVLFE